MKLKVTGTNMTKDLVDEENTLRILSNRPLLSSNKLKCAFKFHSWQQWCKPESARRGVDYYIEQYRRCDCCGIVQRRVVGKF